MGMTTAILGTITIVLLIVAYFRGHDLPLAGLKVASQSLWRNLPILLLGFGMAGLVQVVVPKTLITQWLGAGSGLKGILIACVAGGLVPGAPYAVFPLVASLYRAGAGVGAVIGFVSAWSLWSVTRLPVEMALIEPKVAIIRYVVTFAVPPIAGVLAEVLARWY
jgi:uncharacterized membrane protein YraQ (UPF0718 family)